MTSMMRAKKSSRVISPRRISLNRVPSLMNSTRLVNEAAKASWVTIMMVAFICVFIISSVSSMICALRESRAPVGSSAKMSLGSDTMARARRDALLLPARHLVRVLLQHAFDAEVLRDGLDLGGDVRGRFVLDGESQRDVLVSVEGVEKVGILEDEAQVIAAELRQLALRGSVMSRPPTRMLPPVGNVDGRHAVQKAWSCRNLTVP